MTTIASMALLASAVPAVAGEFDRPWQDNTAIVIDPYRGNSLDLDALSKDERVVAIIHKATQGSSVDPTYEDRRRAARERGYLWGSYHLFTRSDPEAQVDHYLGVTGQYEDEVYALDVECLDISGTCQSNSFRVSIESVEQALRYFREKMGFYPMLYVNGSVRDAFERRWAESDEFKGIPLWYARFRNDISPFFPGRLWPTYSLWQFSSEINCTSASNCPYPIQGIPRDMDINVFWGDVDQLRAAWPIRGE